MGQDTTKTRGLHLSFSGVLTHDYANISNQKQVCFISIRKNAAKLANLLFLRGEVNELAHLSLSEELGRTA